MKKIAAVCSLGVGMLFAGQGLAAEPMAAGAAPAEKVDCGKMLKEKAIMPSKAAELHALLAEMLDLHSKTMAQGTTKEAKAEARAVAKIARENKATSEKLKNLSKTMEDAGNLAPADHEAPKPDPKHAELMAKFLSTEKELSDLLKKDAEAMEQHMKGKK